MVTGQAILGMQLVRELLTQLSGNWLPAPMYYSQAGPHDPLYPVGGNFGVVSTACHPRLTGLPKLSP